MTAPTEDEFYDVIVFVSGAPGDALRAARRYARQIWLVTDMELSWQKDFIDRSVALNPYDEATREPLRRSLQSFSKVAVLTYDERAVVSTASIAATCATIESTSRDAAWASRDKFEMRRRFSGAGLASPAFVLAATIDDAVSAAMHIGFPLVLKPRFGLMSQGVIRVDDLAQLRSAFDRTLSVSKKHVAFAGPQAASSILVEKYLPGREVAVDGIMHPEGLEEIGFFDKPDIGDGPYFEETLYLTPTVELESTRRTIVGAVSAGAAALGLRSGPVHAEVRVEGDVPTLIEIAARPIGGLCGRAYTHCLGRDYHDLVIRGALGMTTDFQAEQPPAASGVLMIPITARGVLRSVDGVDPARRVPWITALHILAKPGDTLAGFPEQDCYLGFIIASGPSRSAVEEALQAAQSCLHFQVAPAEAVRPLVSSSKIENSNDASLSRAVPPLPDIAGRNFRRARE